MTARKKQNRLQPAAFHSHRDRPAEAASWLAASPYELELCGKLRGAGGDFALAELVRTGVVDDIVGAAALWLIENRDSAQRPLLPTLRQRFRISSAEAIGAIRLANYAREEVSQWRPLP